VSNGWEWKHTWPVSGTGTTTGGQTDGMSDPQRQYKHGPLAVPSGRQSWRTVSSGYAGTGRATDVADTSRDSARGSRRSAAVGVHQMLRRTAALIPVSAGGSTHTSKSCCVRSWKRQGDAERRLYDRRVRARAWAHVAAPGSAGPSNGVWAMRTTTIDEGTGSLSDTSCGYRRETYDWRTTGGNWPCSTLAAQAVLWKWIPTAVRLGDRRAARRRAD